MSNHTLKLQVRALDSFYKTLTNEPLKAFYGERHVFRAAEAQAIEVLLISDKLFRARVRNEVGLPCTLLDNLEYIFTTTQI